MYTILLINVNSQELVTIRTYINNNKKKWSRCSDKDLFDKVITTQISDNTSRVTRYSIRNSECMDSWQNKSALV